jgi:hypothetical protein
VNPRGVKMSISLSFSVNNSSSWNGNLNLLEQNIQAAANLWGNILVNSANFSVQLNILPSSKMSTTNALAEATANDFMYLNSVNGQNVFVSSTQLSMMSGTNKNDGKSSDLVINVNATDLLNNSIWINPNPNNGTLSNPSSNQFDFMSIAAHELGHALGINGYRNWDGTIDPTVNGPLSLFDMHITNKGTQYYFSGDNVNLVNNGPAELAVGDLYHVGSYTNLKDPLETDLMNPFSHYGKVDAPSKLDAAILADTGIPTIYNDILRFTSGITSLNAGLGDDTIYAPTWSASIDGGQGTNLTIFTNSSKLYSLSYKSSSLTVTTNSISDTLYNIQKVTFSDLTIDTTSLTKTAALSHTNIVNLVELYIASFNRAPDSVGLDYWGSQLSDGMSLQDIAKSFFVQTETVAAYPSNMPTSDFVTKVYNNVLSRGPDTGGLNYWVGELNNGHVTKDSFLLAIINGAMAPTGSAVDRQTLANKESVGEHYAIYQGLNNSTNWAKDVMSGVTVQMATVTAANAKADGYAAISVNPATSDLIVKLVGVAV